MPVARAVLVGLFAAAFLVAGAGVAVLTADRPLLAASGDDHHECGGEVVLLGKLEPAVDDTGVRGERRVVTYTLATAGLEGGAARVCTTVGEVDVVPSDDDVATLVFTIGPSGKGGPQDVAAAEVRAVFAERSGGLLVVGWHREKRGEDDRVHVDVELRVPATGPWEVAASSGVGDVAVRDLVLAHVVATSGVGDVDVVGEAIGDVTATTGVGNVDLHLAGVGNGAVTATTGVGDVSLGLPRRADVGYDATASTGVGEVDVDIGPTESHREEGGPVGGSVHARSRGYDDKPTKVEVTATSGTGDVRIVAA